MPTRRDVLLTGLGATVLQSLSAAEGDPKVKAKAKVKPKAPPKIPPADPNTPWPPPLKGGAGTVTFTSDEFLTVPEAVKAVAGMPDSAAFTVAKTAPTVDLALHRDLGPNAVNRRLWSSWGDIGVARDGRVYVGIGDHGDDAGGDARCHVHRWDPTKKTLEPLVDMNKVIPPVAGQPAWSKIHAKIDEAPDGSILFCCTLNDGNSANLPKYKWTEKLGGSQLYRLDPKTGEVTVLADLPRGHCTATSILDTERGVWWCNLETGPNALWALDIKTRKVVHQGEPGSMAFNRAFALAADGSIWFNGDKGIWKYDFASGKTAPTGLVFEGSPGMRSASRPTKEGVIYGTTHQQGHLFKLDTAAVKLAMLGPAFLKGDYITVCELSPDQRFLYYLPGAHSGALKIGTPVIQYDIAKGTRKVIAFLKDAMEKLQGFVPAGTYGVKLSPDGGTLYVNFNGHAADDLRPAHLKPIGFGLCGFAAIHIPASER